MITLKGLVESVAAYSISRLITERVSLKVLPRIRSHQELVEAKLLSGPGGGAYIILAE